METDPVTKADRNATEGPQRSCIINLSHTELNLKLKSFYTIAELYLGMLTKKSSNACKTINSDDLSRLAFMRD